MANFENFFNFLKEKRNKNPIVPKLNLGLPILKDELTFFGNLYLSETPVFKLPDNLKIFGNLDLSFTFLKTLPNNLMVNGNLDIRSTRIKELPDDLYVDSYILINYSNGEEIKKTNFNIKFESI